jgi:hypothetical protein
VLGPGAVCVRWRIDGNEELRLLANLCHRPLEGPTLRVGRVIWREGESGTADAVPPWTVCWSIIGSRG